MRPARTVLHRLSPAQSQRPHTYPKVRRLHNIAYQAIFTTLLDEPATCPTFEQYQKAHIIGIPLKPSPPTLEPWVATTADNHQPLPEAPRRLPETGALLCEPFQLPPALAQSIKLALQANGLQNTLFYTSERARGYDWYEQLPVITSVTLSPDHNPRNMTYRPRTLSLTIEAKTVSGNPVPPPHPPDPGALSTGRLVQQRQPSLPALPAGGRL